MKSSKRSLWLGLFCLLVSVVATAVLAGKHVNLLKAPGCGEGSGCDQAAASIWGSVPVIGWPVSFVGLAYFVGLGVAWTAAARAGGIPAVLRNLVRLGAAFSVLFLVAMVFGGYTCLYCIAAHVGNFGFLFVVEAAPRGSARAGRALGWGLAGFVAVTGAEMAVRGVSARKAEQRLAGSIEQITEAGQDDTEIVSEGGGFTGRYLWGPDNAPIRLVIISDFQCPDCRRIEKEVEEVLAARNDVSLSTKHHPFDEKCNPNVRSTQHPNACWAARAAEAAGMLRGDEGYFQMHRWLFDRSGSFTDQEIHDAVVEFGYEPHEFFTIMQGPETLSLVQEDVEEARALGIHYTPMIFINGVELKGWNAPNAVTRAVEAVAATNPPPGSPAQDKPPTAAEKFIADWRDQPVVRMPPDARSWSLGPEDARVEIVLWGDYQEPHSFAADKRLRKLAASRPGTRYTFRHYPINPQCNPVTPADMHPLACLMAQAAEAAGSIGGSEAYWAMHEWLFKNHASITQPALVAAAEEMGLDPQVLFAHMRSSDVAEAIAEDARAASRLGIRGVPFIWINNRRVPRWQMANTLEVILDEAAGN